MPDAENPSAEQVIVPPTADDRQDQVAQESQEQESRQDRNWREINRAKRELERELRMKDELIQRLATSQTQPQVQQPVEEDFIAEIEREEYVPGQKVAKGLKRMEANFKRELQEIEKKYQHKAQVDAYSELKRDMPDLEDVVNPETLELVKQTNPRLAQTWAGKTDYEIYVNAYPYIKNSGLLDKVPGERRSKEVDRKLEENKKTVAAPATFDKRPMAQAFRSRDSQEERQKLYEEMNYFAGRVSGVPPQG